MKRFILGLSLLVLAATDRSFGEGPSAVDPDAAQRGREAVWRPLNPPVCTNRAYENAWTQWGVAEKPAPAEYDRAFRERYGLHLPPYENGKLPMGFHQVRGLVVKGLGNDCLLCHAGSVAGQTYIGLGNASLDIQGLYDDLFAAEGIAPLARFTFGNVRGTIEAGAVVVYLMQFRDADLNLGKQLKNAFRTDLCQDVPAWWLLKKKKTMYHTGAIDARSVRALMPFLLTPLNSGNYIKRQEPVFTDIKAYLLTLEPPKYPFSIDEPLAARGQGLFKRTCARCHGTYGPDGSYPNKIIPLDEIETDPALAEGISAEAAEHYLKSWFAQETGPDGEPWHGLNEGGYQAPPLDGVWATAPYLHNGSVPTVYHMLNSQVRPKIYTRSYKTEKEDYDQFRLGWKITVLDEPPDSNLSSFERRKIYDTTLPGRGNGGHTFGDKLSDEERMAVIEYLKTL